MTLSQSRKQPLKPFTIKEMRGAAVAAVAGQKGTAQSVFQTEVSHTARGISPIFDGPRREGANATTAL
jgi:hypothetical protein